jgi:hypothetical protein
MMGLPQIAHLPITSSVGSAALGGRERPQSSRVAPRGRPEAHTAGAGQTVVIQSSTSERFLKVGNSRREKLFRLSLNALGKLSAPTHADFLM